MVPGNEPPEPPFLPLKWPFGTILVPKIGFGPKNRDGTKGESAPKSSGRWRLLPPERFRSITIKNQSTMALVPQVRIIFDRRKRASATTRGAVEVEAVSNGQRIRITTGVTVLKQQWHDGMVVDHPKAMDLNKTIQDMYDAVHAQLRAMVRNGCVNLETLKIAREVQEVKVETRKGPDFFEWLEERIDKRPVTESTRRQHKVMMRCLQESGLIHSFKDLTPRNIKLWDDHIRTKVTAQSSVHGYHKRLKPYILEAIQLGLLVENPYEGMRISRGKSEGIKFLTEAERNRIEALELYGPVAKARDMFIFSCYTGLAYCDLAKITPEDIIEEDGHLCISDKRQKSGIPYTIVLLPKAIEILKRYNFNINLMTNQKCNENLKLIAQMAKIHLNLTMHVGRHTFATWALSRGVGIEVVSKMLAHTNVAMTEKYAKVLHTNVISGFDKLR